MARWWERIGRAADLTQLAGLIPEAVLRWIRGALWAALFVAMSWLLTKVSALDPAIIIALAAFIVLATIWSVVGFSRWRHLGSSRTSSVPLNPRQLEEKLRGWLMDVIGFSVRRVDDSNPRLLCVYEITDPFRRHIRVAVRSDIPVIELHAVVGLNMDYKAKIESMDPADARRLKRTIAVELAKLNIVNFKVLGIPLEKVEVSHYIQNDEWLTEIKLSESVGFVSRAMMLTLTLLDMELSP